MKDVKTPFAPSACSPRLRVAADRLSVVEQAHVRRAKAPLAEIGSLIAGALREVRKGAKKAEGKRGQFTLRIAYQKANSALVGLREDIEIIRIEEARAANEKLSECRKGDK